MSTVKALPALVLGASIFAGLAVLGYELSHAVLSYKSYERSVTVKGLSEHEYKADIVIWPLKYSLVSNDLNDLYKTLEQQAQKIQSFLIDNGIKAEDLSLDTPNIIDKRAQQYNNEKAPFRFSATQSVTVYSNDIDTVRSVMSKLSELGQEGIIFNTNRYETPTEYLFTRLNEVKPKMIEEATTNARLTAQKFATDSKSRLGKIKRASQGQFSIQPRDNNNPHIKKVRIVSTIEYYLSD